MSGLFDPAIERKKKINVLKTGSLEKLLVYKYD